MKTSFIVLTAFLFQNLAWAADPVRFSGLVHGNNSFVQRYLEKRLEVFQSWDSERQVRFLEKSEKRMNRLIAKLSRMTDQQYFSKADASLKFLNSFGRSGFAETASVHSATESPLPEVQLSPDEVALLSLDSEENQSLETVKPAHQSSKILDRQVLLHRLKGAVTDIESLKSEITKHSQNKTELNRTIAASTAVKAVLTALFAILIGAGIFGIFFGIAIIAGSLGLLAPLGIFVMAMGAVFIVGGIVGIPLVWTQM